MKKLVRTLRESIRRFLMKEAANKSLSRVMNHAEKGHVGIITAHRGHHDAKTNKARNQELAHHLRKAGYGFAHVKGRYVENHGTKDAKPVDEHSFLVFAHHKDSGFKHTLKKLGAKYDQDSVLYKHHGEKNAKLIGTNHSSFPGKDKEHDLGPFHANRVPEFHSVMKRGRTFDFNEDTNAGWIEFGIYNQISFSSREETEF